MVGRESKFKFFGAALAATLAVGSSGFGAVLVTEFMPNPPGIDGDEEWFEIYNSGTLPVDVSNYKVGDEEATPTTSPGTEGMFQFPAGTIMAPGEVYVIAVKATGFNALYGFNPDFETNDTDPAVANVTPYTTWATGVLAIANTNDQVLILNESDQIIDGAGHGGSTFFSSPALLVGQTYERVPANQDTDTFDDWVLREAGQATPGQVTIPEPAALSLLALGGLGLLARRRRTA